jgi:DNA-binding PadR family transcriptional regulator
LALLALLARGQAPGYELKQALESRLGAPYPQLNVGQIHVTLSRLEKAGRIRGRGVDQSGRPNKRAYE